eukprot:16015740-Heterocapsa_arctica.AAC.1
MKTASRKMSKLFRHQDPRIQPFDNGGWFICSDVFDPTKDRSSSLFPKERTGQFLYNLMLYNEKQRFQLAIVTADAGESRRTVTQIYAIR